MAKQDTLITEIQSLTTDEIALIDFMVKVKSRLINKKPSTIESAKVKHRNRESSKDYRAGYSAGYMTGRHRKGKSREV